MDAHKLCEALGGECSMNRMVAWVGGKKQVIAKSVKGEWKLEPVGAAEAAKINAGETVGVEEPANKPKRKYTRKPKVFRDEDVEVSGSDEL